MADVAVGGELTPEELAVLKSLAHKPKEPLRKNYALWVAVAGFSLSLVTAALSVHTNYRKDVNDQVARLSATIQTVQDLNLKTIEIHEKYKDTPYATQAGNLLAAQANDTLRQARTLAFQLGTKASSAALGAVGFATEGVGDVAGAQKLYELALAAAETALDEGAALRLLGVSKIRQRSGPALQEGEELLLRAANLERKYPDLHPETLLWEKAMTRLYWGGALAPLNCQEARKHVREATSLLEAPFNNLGLQQLRAMAAQQAAGGIGGVTGCTLDAAAVPRR